MSERSKYIEVISIHSNCLYVKTVIKNTTIDNMQSDSKFSNKEILQFDL